MIRELKLEDETADIISEFSKGDKGAEIVLTRLVVAVPGILIPLSLVNLRGANIMEFYRSECDSDPSVFSHRLDTGDVPSHYLTDD